MAKKSRSRSSDPQPAIDGKSGQDRQSRFMMLALEPRFMFDGAAVATAAEGVSSTSGDTGWHDTSRDATANAHAVEAAEPATQAATRDRTEIVFVDKRVTDYQAIIDAINPSAEVVLLEGDQDGVAQMAAALAGRETVDAIHVISHGDEGVLLLGDAPLHAGNMDRYAGMLADIGRSLTDSGDIHLWGCEVGAGDRGLTFLNALAAATGADIAASLDSTGSAEGGGDWELEITTGDVAASSALNTSLLGSYDYQLATFAVASLSELQAALTTAASNGQDDTITLTADITATGAGNFTGGYLAYINLNESHALTIVGGGHTLDANYYGRGVYVSVGDTVEIQNLTIQGGLATGDGGNGGASATNSLGAGIVNHGGLTLRDVTVTANLASGGGGGGGVTDGSAGGGGGGGGGYAGRGGGAGGDSGAGIYSGQPGGGGSGGDGGGYSSNYMGGKGGTATGGAGSTGTFGYSNGGAGGTASNGSLSIGGGGGGSGWNAVGGAGGSAVGGIFNASGGTLTVVGTSIISNNIGAGGGGGGGSGAGSNNLDGGAGGRGVGAIWNEGTVRMTAANFSAMTGNAGASGAGGLEGGTGSPGVTPAAQNSIYTADTGTTDTSYVDNAAPALDANGAAGGTSNTTTFTEDGGPVRIVASDATLSNDGTITGMTLVISATPDGTDEGISYNAALNGGASLASLGLTGSYNAATRTYTIDGTASPAVYQGVLRAMVYNNASQSPDATARTVTITATDDGGAAGQAAATINVSSVNDPVVVTVPAAQTVAEDTPLAFTGARLITIADPDDLGGTLRAELRVSNGTLSVANTTGVTGNNSGFLTIVGTEAQINEVLAGLSYRGTQDFHGSDSLEVKVFDNGNSGERPGSITTPGADYEDGSSNRLVTTRTVEVTVTPVNDAPVFNDLAGPMTYTENGAGVLLDGDASIWDAELSGRASGNGNWNGAVLTIARYSGGAFLPNANDILEATGTLSFAATGAGAGDVIVNGTTVGTYAQPVAGRLEISFNSAATNDMVASVLQQITYRHEGDAPPASLTLRVQIADGNTGIGDQGSGGNKTAATQLLVNVTRNNDRPAIIGLDNTVTYTEGQPAVIIDSSVDLLDAELDAANNWSGATLTLRRDGGANAEDVFEGRGTLSFTGAGSGNVVLGGTTVGSYTLSGGQLMISFNSQATADRVDAVAQQIAYRNTSDHPPASVTLAFIVNDGGNSSSQGGAAQTNLPTTITVDITPVNDAPTLSGLPGSAAYSEGASPTLISPSVTLTDSDSPDYNGGSLMLELVSGGSGDDRLSIRSQGYGAGQIGFDGTNLLYGGVVIGSVSGGEGTQPLIVSFTSGAATRAAVEALIKNLTFSNNSEHPDTAARTARLTIVDGDGTANGGADTYVSSNITLTVSRVNDAPVLSGLGGTASHTEGGAATVLAPGASLSDAELDLRGNWAGATLTLARQGAADASDLFEGSGSLTLAGNGDVVIGGTNVGTYTMTGGQLRITFNGNATPALADQVAQNIAYRYAGDSPPASVTIGWTLSDGNTGISDQGATGVPLTGTGSVTVTVAAVNDAPVLTAPASISVTEDTAAALTGISIADVDAGSGPVTVTLSVPAGTLSATSGGGVTAGGTAGALTLSGSVADINAFLAAEGVIYTPAPNDTGARVLTITVNDNGNTGTGGAHSDTRTVSLTIAAVNDAPVLMAPAGISVTEDTAAALTGIAIVDVDAGANPVTMTLSVPAGTLSAVSGSGVVVGGTAGALTLSGSIADINAFLAAEGVTYTPDPNDTGTRVLTITVDDGGNTGSGGARSDTQTINLSISAVNDAPVLTAPASIDVTENTATPLTGIAIADVDAGSGWVTVTLSVPAGALSATSGSGVTVGGTGSALTLSGSVADINAYLAAEGVTYTPDPNDTGARVLTITVNDNGNTGTGGAHSDTRTVSLAIAAVNDAPTITAPAGISVTEDTAAALTGIAIADVDAGSGPVTVTLSVPAGALSAVSGSGVTVGGTAGALTLSGSVADINAFLASAGVTYAPAANDTGTRVLTITVDDNGNTGSGGARSDTQTINLSISAVNDAPVLTAPASISITEDTTTPLTGIAIADVDAGANPVTVTLSVPAGVLSATSGSGVVVGGTGIALTLSGTVADINAFLAGGQLTYAPAPDAASDQTLTVEVTDNGNTGTGGARSAHTTIILDAAPVNDAPVITAPPSISVTEDTAAALTGISIADVDAGSGPVTVTLSVPAGTLAAVSGSGVTVSASGVTVGGTGSALTLSGSIADINAFLAGGQVTYAPVADAAADQTLTVTVDDGGNTGAGGARSAEASIILAVVPVNDAPTATNLSQLIRYTEDDDQVALGDIVITDSDSRETVTATLTLSDPAAGSLSVGTFGNATSRYDAGAGVWTVTGSVADVNAALAAVAFTPAANRAQDVTITTRIRDAANSGPADGTIRLTATPINDAPTAEAPLPDVAWRGGDNRLTLPGDAFADVDGDSLTYTAGLAGGEPLPGWLRFDGDSMTLSGRPPVGSGTLTVVITATDTQGAAATSSFRLTYTNPAVVTPPSAPVAPPAPAVALAPAAQAPAPIRTVIRAADLPLSQAVPDDSGWFAPLVRDDVPTMSVSRPVLDMAVAAGQFTLVLPQDFFFHPDPNALLRLEARLPDGSPLPPWLSFDPETGTFTGEAPQGVTALTVQVIAQDPAGQQARAEIQLKVGGQAAPVQPVGAVGQAPDASAEPHEKAAPAERSAAAAAAGQAAGEPVPGKPAFSRQLALARQGGVLTPHAALVEAAREVARVTRS